MATTDELLKTIQSKREIGSYLQDYAEDMIEFDLPAYLAEILQKKNLKKAEAVAASGIDRTYCYQIFSGRKLPSRSKLLQLCIGMQLTIEETQTLLKRTGFTQLYPRNKRDSIILFALENGMKVTDTDLLLDKHGLAPLNQVGEEA